MSRWYLLADYDFYNQPKKEDEETRHMVFMVNLHQWDVLASFNVNYIKETQTNELDTIYITIKTMPSLAPSNLIDILYEVLQPKMQRSNRMGYRDCGYCIGTNEFSDRNKNEIQLGFYSIENLKIFTSSLPEINNLMGKEIFSQDLILEINNMTEFCESDQSGTLLLNRQYQHTIPRGKYYYEERPFHHTKINDLLLARKDKLSAEDLKQVKVWLSQGEHPNLLGYHGHCSLLSYATDKFYMDLELITLLLYYRGDLTLRLIIDLDSYSAYDYALIRGHAPLIKLFESILNRLERPLGLRVKNIRTYLNEGNANTDIDWCKTNDPQQRVVETVTTILKKSADELEAAIILLWCASTFSLQNDLHHEKLMDVIKKELSAAPGKFVEIIRGRRGAMIGFNIFELITTNNRKNIYWYCSLSYISPHYRIHGMMTFLNWRGAFAIQHLCYEATVGVYYLAASFNSYRLVQDDSQHFVHWPMYQPKHVGEEIIQLLSRIEIGAAAEYHHDGLVCFVDEQLSVIDKGRPSAHFYREQFLANVLDQHDTHLTASKAAPVMFYVADSSYPKFESFCRQIGINLETYLTCYSMFLKVFLHDHLPENVNDKSEFKSNCIKNEFRLFWNNESVPSEIVRKPGFNGLVAKL